MSLTYQNELKEFILKDFQKHLDKEPPIDGEKLTVKKLLSLFS